MGAPEAHEDGGRDAPSVVTAARSYAYDRYLSALLAPAPARDDLVVLAAFLGEIARIPLLVREAAMAEIRLTWWRDEIGAGAAASGHPVADAVAEMAARRGLSRDLLLAPVEGMLREVYEDGIGDSRDLSLYADETQGAVLRLALAVLGAPSAGAADTALGPAARALALTRLALTLPQHLAHGRFPLPPGYAGVDDPRASAPEEARAAARAVTDALVADASAALGSFRAAEGRLVAAAKAAFLPLALVAPALAAVAKPGRDVLHDVADISPLSRVVRLWFAHWRGRV